MMNIQKYSGWQIVTILEIDNNVNEYVFHNKKGKKELVLTHSLLSLTTTITK